MDAAAAAVSTLSALAVFASTLDHGAVRSVHGYKVYGRGGRRRWERWVEREFVLTPASCREVPAPVAPPRILPAEWRGRPAYREGQVVAAGAWRCILAFDSAAAAAAPPRTPPPVLSPFLYGDRIAYKQRTDSDARSLHDFDCLQNCFSLQSTPIILSLRSSVERNPRLMCVPSLYNDLEKVFRFQNVEKIPKLMQCDSEEKLSSWDARDKSSDEVHASESDSDDDLQSGEEEKPTVQKQRRANKKHIASITLVDIAQYFHLPIREASRTLKIGVSILKRKCRQYNIPRWPHRKIKSLDSLIQDLEYVINDGDDHDDTGDDVQQEKHKQTAEEKQEAIMALTRRKQMLETEKETIQQIPAMDLKVETKQFREDVFKRRYRAKKDLAND
uniref:RWP-RK domain-containing protein n=1 Tax=Oryza meridionalis TaxID=40149 RepID=A0A0E0DH82_9ORYZ